MEYHGLLVTRFIEDNPDYIVYFTTDLINQVVKIHIKKGDTEYLRTIPLYDDRLYIDLSADIYIRSILDLGKKKIIEMETRRSMMKKCSNCAHKHACKFTDLYDRICNDAHSAIMKYVDELDSSLALFDIGIRCSKFSANLDNKAHESIEINLKKGIPNLNKEIKIDPEGSNDTFIDWRKLLKCYFPDDNTEWENKIDTLSNDELVAICSSGFQIIQKTVNNLLIQKILIDIFMKKELN